MGLKITRNVVVVEITFKKNYEVVPRFNLISLHQ